MCKDIDNRRDNDRPTKPQPGPETTYVDYDGDGVIDAVLIDVTGDGVTDVVLAPERKDAPQGEEGDKEDK